MSRSAKRNARDLKNQMRVHAALRGVRLPDDDDGVEASLSQEQARVAEAQLKASQERLLRERGIRV